METIFDQDYIDMLWKQASESPRLRIHYDLRNSVYDTSQRMLNALLPGTKVPIHRHEETAETVICLCGKLEEIIYDELPGGTFQEVSRKLLCPAEGRYGMQIPKGAWHTICVIEPSVIFEAKDGAYQPR